MKNQTKIQSTVKKVNEWYASKSSLIFFICITTIFGLFQLILFVTGTITVNDHTFGEENSYLAWIAIAISIASCYFGFIGGIMVFRGSFTFIYWQSAQMITSLIIAALSGMWLGSFALAYSLMFVFIRHFSWKAGIIEKWNLSKEKLFLILTIVLISTLTFFILIENYFEELHYIPGINEPKPKWTWYFDAFNASLSITATTMMFFKWRWCFVLFFITKIFIISNYAYANMYVPIIQMLMFVIMDVTGFFAWSTHILDNVNEGEFQG
ncbi:MAG: hypothetical protein TYPL_2920 [Candidatus Tyloplasma litorale]|nr:MAG: hypothetical protein TYPL_2920 [Mycoplasmatales bacterium]